LDPKKHFKQDMRVEKKLETRKNFEEKKIGDQKKFSRKKNWRPEKIFKKKKFKNFFLHH